MAASLLASLCAPQGVQPRMSHKAASVRRFSRSARVNGRLPGYPSYALVCTTMLCSWQIWIGWVPNADLDE